MTAQLTLGVIGHVDHGKTALVRALTGIETDRLKEEKERGLSIVLGFSYLEGKHGMIDLIDVPGHEDFVRTMISGATGIDGALLIVAANEGIMPQTREHLEITHLLGVDRGLIVITKHDLVSDEELELAIDDVRSAVGGTFLEKADLVCTSAETGYGLDELRAALDLLEPVQERGAGVRHPFLPIDRAFVMRGFGPVVTGTLRGGALEANRKVELLPAGLSATIRGLQVHNQPVERATPGQRVAVNLRNVKREDLRRGDTLAARGFLKVTRRIDVELELLESRKEALRNGATLRLLVGTTEVMAKVRLLDRQHLEPGAKGLVQLRLNRELATHQTERFIIRSYSPMRTIGGGSVIDAHPSRHRRFDAAVTDHLETAARGSAAEKARMLLAEAGLAGATVASLEGALGLNAEEIGGVLAGFRPVTIGADKLIDASAYSRLMDAILTEIARYHDAHPLERGITPGSVRTTLGAELADDVFQDALSQLLSDGRVENDGGILRLPGFDPLAGLSDGERRVAAAIEEAFRTNGLTPPTFEQVVGRDRAKREIFQLLCRSGRLVRLKTKDRKGNMVLHAENLDEVIARIKRRYAYPRKFAVKDVRDLLGSTRKYILPLVEHLDATGVTIRMGDFRQLRT